MVSFFWIYFRSAQRASSLESNNCFDLARSLTHELTNSRTYSLTHPPTHPPTHSHTVTHSHSLFSLSSLSLSLSLTHTHQSHSLSHSLSPSLTHTLTLTHSRPLSLKLRIRRHTHSHSLTHSLTRSLARSPTHSPAHPFTRLIHHSLGIHHSLPFPTFKQFVDGFLFVFFPSSSSNIHAQERAAMWRAVSVLCLVGLITAHSALGVQVHSTQQSNLMHSMHSSSTRQENQHTHEENPSPLQLLSRQIASSLGLDVEGSLSTEQSDTLHRRLEAAFFETATPIFLETFAGVELRSQAQAKGAESARAPFDPATGLSEPTADCRRLLTDWMAKCAFGPRPT